MLYVSSIINTYRFKNIKYKTLYLSAYQTEHVHIYLYIYKLFKGLGCLSFSNFTVIGSPIFNINILHRHSLFTALYLRTIYLNYVRIYKIKEIYFVFIQWKHNVIQLDTLYNMDKYCGIKLEKTNKLSRIHNNCMSDD